MHTEIQGWVGWLWLGFVVVWIVAAFNQKRTIRRETTGSRFLYFALGITAFMLMTNPKLGFGLLGTPFVPKSAFFSYLGLSLMIVGFAFAIWARVFLGGNWSSAVTVKKDHTLVRKGPYALVRHPIYTGVLLASLGTAIVFRGTRGLLAVALATVALYIKLRKEELFMTEQFGEEYAEYKQNVKRLIPFVW